MKHAARKRRRHPTGLRIAIPAFLLSLLAFGVALLLPWVASYWERPEPTEAVGEQGKVRRLCVLLHDESLVGALSITTDTRTLSVEVTGYPVQTEVVYRTALSTLSYCYAEEGDAAASYLASITGLPYDAVISLSVDAVATLASQLGGGISYTLPQAVGTLPEGTQWLSPLQMADVIRYTEWDNVLTGPATVQSGLVAAFLNRYWTVHTDMEAAFRALTALSDDHLTVAQFAVIRHDLDTLSAANSGALCTASVPEGKSVGVGDNRRYVLLF